MLERSKHDAPGQLAGYLYQVLTALLLLFESKNPDTQICIERFDDVVFIEEDVPLTMIQTKHHISKSGNLNDTSVDLWRTINSWCSSIKAHKNTLKDTKFVIITTSYAENESAASYLTKANYRDWSKAKSILQRIALESTVKTNGKFYSSFLLLDEEEKQSLFKNIYVCDCASSISNIKNDMMPYIRATTLPPFEERVYDKILGWWINAIIKCLTSAEPAYISYRELQGKLFDIGSEYKADSLPVDVDPQYQPSDSEFEALHPENRLFTKQLNLIGLSSDRLKRCKREYYNAYRQRSKWVREQLLFIDDLTTYETNLTDEWERLFLIMKENISDYGDLITENEKCHQGRTLFNKVEDFNLPLRKNVTQPFIMRGTYHELANQLKVGWHIDFMERLCSLRGRE